MACTILVMVTGYPKLGFQVPGVERKLSEDFFDLTEHKQRAVNNAVELRILGSSTTGSSLSPSKQTNQLPLALLLLLRLQPFPPNPLSVPTVDFKWISEEFLL